MRHLSRKMVKSPEETQRFIKEETLMTREHRRKCVGSLVPEKC